jgi:hypothetical protein
MKDLQWKSLVQSLVSGTCVLVLGPDIPAVARDADASKETSVRDAFSQYLIDQLEGEGLKIDERAMFAVAQQFEDWPTLTNLKNIAADFFRTTPHDPGPLHIELARCPFSLILTTCHDDLLTKALHGHNKSAVTPLVPLPRRATRQCRNQRNAVAKLSYCIPFVWDVR